MGTLETFSSITEAWVITVGMFGIVGFSALFGLLALPIFGAASALKFATSDHDGAVLVAPMLMAAFSIFDLLPNSGLSPVVWLFTGALLGRALEASARQLTMALSESIKTQKLQATVLKHSTYANEQRPKNQISFRDGL